MGTTIILTDRIEQFGAFTARLEKEGVSWSHHGGGTEDVLVQLAGASPGMTVVDDRLGGVSGVKLIRSLLERNAFLNIAAVSLLPPADFHEETEGLGIVMQLSSPPTEEDAVQVAAHASLQA